MLQNIIQRSVKVTHSQLGPLFKSHQYLFSSPRKKSSRRLTWVIHLWISAISGCEKSKGMSKVMCSTDKLWPKHTRNWNRIRLRWKIGMRRWAWKDQCRKCEFLPGLDFSTYKILLGVYSCAPILIIRKKSRNNLIPSRDSVWRIVK